jgi:aspartate 1-decarboxylase
MKRTLLKSKIHRATITESNLNYEGSISIDRELIASAGLVPFERVEIYNCNNGERFATYVIEGDSGEICVNGAAARLVQKGDLIIICSYAEFEEAELTQHKPTLVFVDKGNRAQEIKTAPLTKQFIPLDL